MVCTPARSSNRSLGKRLKKSTPSRRELPEIKSCGKSLRLPWRILPPRLPHVPSWHNRATCVHHRSHIGEMGRVEGVLRETTHPAMEKDRKSTRLNSSHRCISY